MIVFLLPPNSIADLKMGAIEWNIAKFMNQLPPALAGGTEI
jgi:hypothetical protein